MALKELCAHPIFRSEAPREHAVDCYATTPGADAMPKAMRVLKNEIKTSPLLPLDHTHGSKMQQTPAVKEVASELQSFLDKLQKAKHLRGAKQLQQRLTAKQQQAPAPMKKQQAAASVDDVEEQNNDLLAEFWTGDACLYGGAGYWKIELCFGKSVCWLDCLLSITFDTCR